MKDLQLQTPQRDQNSDNRRLKTGSDLKRNLHKTAKKSLNPVLKADFEDGSTFLESLKEFSPASDDNPFAESAKNFLSPVHPAETHSSVSVAVSDLTSTLSSSSATATPYKHIAFDTANTEELEVDMSKVAESVEAEMVIKHLRKARIQALKSKDVGPSKKVMDALINIIIEDFHGGLYKEDEWLDKLLSKRYNLVFLICIMWLFSLLMVWFLRSSPTGSFTGPPPT